MMQLYVLILKRPEWIEPLFEEMMKNGFTGATVLTGAGMMHTMDANNPDLPMFSAIRHLIDPARTEAKVVFTLVNDSQIAQLTEIVRRVTGGLDKPDTGVAFALPITFAEGLMVK